MPPTISASTEITQPTSITSRLDVSTLTAWPGSAIAEMPKRSAIRSATGRGLRPSLTVTAIVVTSPGRRARRCTSGSGSTAPASSNRSPLWKIPPTRNSRPATRIAEPGLSFRRRAAVSPSSSPFRVPATSVSRCAGNSPGFIPKRSDDGCPPMSVT